MIKDCEDNLARLENHDDNDTDEEYKMRQNAKICLAISLQEVTPQLRMLQREMFQEVQRSSSINPLNNAKQNRQPLQQQQLLMDDQNDDFEVDYIEYLAQDRDERIKQLAEKVTKMTTLFRELNRLVIEQGTLLDRIDFNLEQTFQRVKKGKKELQQVNQIYLPLQANIKQVGSNRAQNCICILVMLNVLFIIILVIKFTVY